MLLPNDMIFTLRTVAGAVGGAVVGSATPVLIEKLMQHHA
jgi:hypothetical protein